MKLAILATLLATAAAFAPAPSSKASTALKVNELEIGVTDPLGVFDPLGWLETQPEAFERRRAVERKHGRISMVAVIGMLVHNAGIELPGSMTLDGSVKFSDISDGFTGLFEVPAFGLAQILLATGLMELVTWPASDYSGDYGTGYLGRTLEGEELKFKLDMELNQGRAAMLGIFGAMIQEGIQGQTLAEHIQGGGAILIPGLF
mmetsp:Transcript_19194/g.40015  ORF Transcript_19194/g.40015 Transcript_19194/m.40015 type:complete len:204 (-) Transcript_19194:209-820(-)|eukprot:CAMPEP_0118656852 /NCGR_PEP_ID=MMETSP0785-20121206/13701_1 /TAXON_ID=91992 /ORGANISM="Bolidomonas pacifica, Strain CCMP 1866" /LENGTH=203 /DNA_ID=CAMNT_0006549721 /DNA_START=67 /DNA_END=678 /DNA_ORIENTATION=+